MTWKIASNLGVNMAPPAYPSLPWVMLPASPVTELSFMTINIIGDLRFTPIELIQILVLMEGSRYASASPVHEARGLGDDIINAAITALLDVKPTATPTAIGDASSAISRIFAAAPTSVLDIAKDLLEAGLAPVDDLLDHLDVNKTGTVGGDSQVNNTPPLPSNASVIFPQASPDDVAFSVSEAELRQAIFIPSNFTYGQRPPLLLVHGTGIHAFTTYSSNVLPHFYPGGDAADVVDPVWINVPGFLLGDAQRSAEYVAYALQYVHAVTQQKVAVMGYSQGAIIVQWALTFWPSAAAVTSDFMAFSAAFAGSDLVSAGCLPIAPFLGCPPAIFQQMTGSDFVKALAAHGGDSAQVPTTVIYSHTDEIAQPQFGDHPTAGLKDANGVGFTGVAVQDACPGAVGGSFYTHEGMLYHPLVGALAKDAFTHDGPADLSRIDTASLCGNYAALDAGFDGFVKTEGELVLAGLAFLEYRPWTKVEPALMAYAQ
ncbi:putative lipase [Mycena polygramma]|nr:putative lipase [Mycena polygramma]